MGQIKKIIVLFSF